MKHYSREHGRSQAKIAELERRKGTCEAGLAAITACWTQVRLFVLPIFVLFNQLHHHLLVSGGYPATRPT
jgi:hypothetical protein